MEVRAEIVRLYLAQTFTISRESQDWADVVHVTIDHDGIEGRGEAAPIERYGETAESALAFVEQHSDVVGHPPPDPTRRYSRFHAASPCPARSRQRSVVSERSYCAFQ